MKMAWRCGNGRSALTFVAVSLLAGCVTQVYRPGSADNPLNHLKLGQSYGDMVRALGVPSHSESEDRSGKTMATAVIPVVGLAAIASPTSLQIYRYDHIGTVTIDNDNRIVRIEAE